MQLIETSFLDATQKEMVFHLWNAEYPERLVYKNISELDSYLDKLENTKHLLLVNEKKGIDGWAFTFDREKERWFSIILDSKIQRQKKGTALLNKLKEKEELLNGWVTDHNTEVKRNGDTYLSPLNFYLKNNFSVYPEIRLETEKISAVKITWKRNQVKN